MVRPVTRNVGHGPGQDPIVELELALVDVRDSGVEFLWGQPIQEWSEITVSMVASGRRERFQAQGIVVACRPASRGLWSISLFFTALASRENPWPPA